LASSYFGLGQAQKAIEILQRRLQQGPQEVFPVVSLGMALLANGDKTNAVEKFRQATSLDEKYPLAWLGLGKSLAAQNESQQAEQAYRRAFELAPSLIEARVNLADLLMKRGQLDEAAAVCSAALSDSPDMASVYLKLAEIDAKRHNYDQSLADCDKARQFAPYTHPSKVVLAVYCLGNGDPQTGLRLLHEAREESPNYPMIPLIEGQLASRDQRWDAAREYFASAAALPIPENWPDSHRQRFLVLLQSERFRLAQQLQDINLARDALAQWVKCDPANTRIRQEYEHLRASAAPQ
jgi:tetratricopeptide (TPR) repeat protein